MRPKAFPLWIFFSVEAILYLSFLWCDLRSFILPGTCFKYAALLLCLAMGLDNLRSRDGRLVAAALALTAAADLFLLVLNCCYAVGIAFFCAVQLLYARRIFQIDRRAFSLWPRLMLSAAALFFLAVAGLLDPLAFLVCLYFPQLLCSALQSLRLPPSRTHRLFSAGLWLFVACDLCVGLYNSTLYFPSPLFSHLASLVQIGMWLFYLPSQVCITLSASRRLPP